MMDLEKACRPFDRTYADVTRRIREFAARLQSPDSDWLNRLIDAFAEERDEWEARPELTRYRARMLMFRTRILQLVAGAYLHISYDLPRAMADEWPGSGGWAKGPVRDRGQQLYFQLSEIFPEALVQSASEFGTVGFAAILQRRTAKDALAPAAMWVDYQRVGAWTNAEFLARSHNRGAAEAKMAEAMTAALDDASLWRPWSLAHLRPPLHILQAPAWTSWAALLPLVEGLVRALVFVVPTAFATWQFARDRFRLETLGSFLDAWGMLTTEYVAYAVREPDGFDAYRERRRAELGVAPRGAAATG